MFGLFENKLKITIGLDLGHDSIKYIKLRRTGKSPAVLSYGLINITEKTKLTDVLKSLLKNEDLSLPIFTSVSGSGVFIQNFILTYLPENKLEDTVKLASQKYISVPIETTNFAFKEIAEIEERKTKRKKVIIVAAEKELIDKKIKIIEDAGLQVEEITGESIAYWNLMQFIEPDLANFAIIDIGKESTKISAFQNGILSFVREIITSGHSMIEAIGHLKSLSFNEAFDLIKNKGFSNDNKEVVQAITPVFDRLISEIERTFSYYKQKENDFSIDKILLTGSVAMMPGLQAYLEKKLGYSVEVLNPFTKTDISFSLKDPSQLKEQGPLFSLALGLALESKEKIDLLPIELKQKRLMAILSPYFIFLYIATLILLAIVYTNVYTKCNKELSILNSLKLNYANQTQNALTPDQIKTKVEKIKTAKTTFDKIEYSKKFNLGILKEIIETLPDFIVLENLVLGTPEVDKKIQKTIPLKMTGFAFGNEIDLEVGLFNFRKTLISKPIFTNCDISNRDKTESNILRFTITCDINLEQ